MRKLKLLMVACTLLLGAGQTWAAVDWTDKTSLITNPSFETDAAIADLTKCGWATNRATGWTISPSSSSNAQVGVGNSSSTIQGIGSTFSPSDGEKYFYTRNNWNANTMYSFTQVITRDGDNLPAGLYKLTCKAATFSSNAAFNTLTIGLKEGTGSAVTHNGIVLNVWNTWGVIIYKRADDTNLTIEVNFKPGYGTEKDKHYALLMDDFHLEYISEDDAFTASSSNTIDFSDVINNAGIYNHSTQGTLPRGWTATKHTTGNGNYTEAASSDTRLEGWSGSNLDIDYNQTITNLPAGIYTVTAAVQERAKVGRTYVYAYTEGKDKATGLVNNTPEYDVTTSELNVSNGTMKIGIESTANDWVTADNFRISFLGFDVDAVKADYETAYTNAETARDAAENANIVGTERTTFEGVITTYTTDDTQSYSWYVSAKEALESATTAFIAVRDSYDALVAMRTTGGTYTTVAWPRASAAKKTALDDAIAADAPTDAADAVTKTNAIVTAYRQFVESNGLAEGVDVAVDYTSTYLAGADPDVNTDWTNGIGVDRRNQEVYTKGDGTTSGKYYDGGWSTSAAVNINMTRELTLPEGQYQLQITARGSSSLTSYTMSIGGETVNLPKDGADAAEGTFGHGWSDKFVVFNSDGSTPLTLAIAATSTEYQQWISFNRLRLIRLDATLADATDYSNLNDAIDGAEAKTLGFEDDEYAPYANTIVLVKLAEAKAINQSANNEQDVVQGLTTYLNNAANWTANDGDVDAIYNGMFTESQPGDRPLAWTRSSNWGQLQSGVSGDYATAFYNQPGSISYGNDGVYTMPLAANTAYALTFSYRSHEGDSNKGMTVSVLNEGSEGLAETAFEGNGSTSNWKTVTKNFKTGAAGNYVLTLANGGNTWMTNVSLVKATSESVTVTDAGFATYVSDVDLDFTSTAIKAYKVKVSEKGKATLTKVDKVPAGTPVLLYVDGGKTENIPVIASASAVSDNDLVAGTGAAVATTDGGYTNMILNNVSGIGFYFANGQTVATNRAYLRIASSLAPDAEGSGSRMVMVFADETTGISSHTPSLSPKGEGSVYTLSGQRVETPKKGLYIKNGKKVIIK